MTEDEPIICPQCNRFNQAGSHFCQGCGLSLDESGNIHGPQIAEKGFLSSRELTETPWPAQYIYLGLGILLLSVTIPYIFPFTPLVLKPNLYGYFIFISTVIFEAILIIFTLVVLKQRQIPLLLGKMSPSFILKEILRDLYSLLLILLAFIPIGIILYFLFKETSSFDNWNFLKYTPVNFSIIVAFLISSFTLGPVAEELFFRGFLYNALKSRLRIPIATLIQALVFALMHHYSITGRLFIFFFGIALVIVYEKRETLLAPIFVHGLKNAMVAVPMIFLLFQNYHVPAATWQEAQVNPDWVDATPSVEIVHQKDGVHQWQYAINKWGSKGSKKWKKEVNAFNAVIFWFPEDKKSCAKAKLGIITIYVYYLKDYRRAIIEVDRLLASYPEQGEQVASALSEKGLAYLMLNDFKRSRAIFNTVINDFKDYKSAYEAAQKGTKLLDKLEGT